MDAAHRIVQFEDIALEKASIRKWTELKTISKWTELILSLCYVSMKKSFIMQFQFTFSKLIFINAYFEYFFLSKLLSGNFSWCSHFALILIWKKSFLFSGIFHFIIGKKRIWYGSNTYFSVFYLFIMSELWSRIKHILFIFNAFFFYWLCKWNVLSYCYKIWEFYWEMCDEWMFQICGYIIDNGCTQNLWNFSTCCIIFILWKFRFIFIKSNEWKSSVDIILLESKSCNWYFDCFDILEGEFGKTNYTIWERLEFSIILSILISVYH